MRPLRLCALDGLTNRDFATAEATELLPLLSLFSTLILFDTVRGTLLRAKGSNRASFSRGKRLFVAKNREYL